jgi:hypothetical protein
MILRAEANLVETGLTVRDANGRAVGGLHASDFEVLDNGAPKQIAAFSELRSDGKPTAAAFAKSPGTVPLANVPPPGPKYVTFFFDDFHMSSATALFVKHAAHAYIFTPSARRVSTRHPKRRPMIFYAGLSSGNPSNTLPTARADTISKTTTILPAK